MGRNPGIKHCRKIRQATDMAEDNPRSLAAHLKSGFEILDTLQYGGIRWNVVLWNWKG